MRVLVSGGNGFIGSVVVRKLVEQGAQVRCLLRHTSLIERIQDLDFEKSFGDICDLGSVEKALKGCDAVIHLASLSDWNDINSPKMDTIVIEGSKNIISSALKIPNIKMIYVSSAAAINGSSTPEIFNEESSCTLNLQKFSYSRAKRSVEALCKDAHQQGLSVVTVNPGEVYGPNDTGLITAGNLVDFANSTPALVCSGGTSVVHLDDVAEGIICALSKGKSGERYILGGDNLSIRQLAELTLKILEKKSRIIQVPNWALKTASNLATTLHLPFPINPAVIPYATMYWFMDNQKARNELGLQFRNAEQTLTPTLKWLKEAQYI